MDYFETFLMTVLLIYQLQINFNCIEKQGDLMTRILLVSGFQQHMLDEIKNGHESWITHAIVVNCGVGAIYSPTPSALHYGERW